MMPTVHKFFAGRVTFWWLKLQSAHFFPAYSQTMLTKSTESLADKGSMQSSLLSLRTIGIYPKKKVISTSVEIIIFRNYSNENWRLPMWYTAQGTRAVSFFVESDEKYNLRNKSLILGENTILFILSSLGLWDQSKYLLFTNKTWTKNSMMFLIITFIISFGNKIIIIFFLLL